MEVYNSYYFWLSKTVWKSAFDKNEITVCYMFVKMYPVDVF